MAAGKEMEPVRNGEELKLANNLNERGKGLAAPRKKRSPSDGASVLQEPAEIQLSPLEF